MSGGAPSNAVSSNGVGVVPDSLLNAFVQTDQTAAQLRGFIGITGMSAMLQGVYAPGDGGGGLFYWASGSYTDNNSSVIVPYGATGQGAWLLSTLNFIINQVSTGEFYAENGAVIDRMNDRVFIGAATPNAGNPNGVGTQDWLETLIPDTTSIATLASISQIGGAAIVGATRSSDSTGGFPLFDFAGAFFGINNNTTQDNTVETLYVESRHYVGAYRTLGIESDIVALAGASSGSCQPYSPFGIASANLWLSCARPDVSSGNATVAIGVVNNSGGTSSGQYTAGIVFDANSLVGTTAASPGSSAAILMAKGHQIQWWDANGVAAFITSAATSTDPVELAFSSGGLAFLLSGGNNVLEITGVSSAVNYMELSNNITGDPPSIEALGSDTNIDLALIPKGTGAVWLGAYTTSAPSATGFITVRDSTGTTRKLLCA